MSSPSSLTGLLMYGALETLLNQALTGDERGREQLAALDGTVVRLRGESPMWVLYVLIYDDGVERLSDYEGPVDVRVRGALGAMLHWLLAPNSGDAFNTYLLQQTPLCATNATAGNATTCVDARAAAAPGPIGEYCAGFDGDAAACATQWGGLDFDEATYAAIGLLGSVGSVLGNWLFRRFLLQAQWHCMFATTVVCACASSALQLLLMFRDPANGVTLAERWHMPNVVFALGDDVVMATANQLLAMPILILMARLCPVGAEGTAYALVTSVQMVGGTVSGILAQQATRAFGVTNQNFARLWQLTLLTSVAKLVALPLLPLVPSSASLDAAQSDDRRFASDGDAMRRGSAARDDDQKL